MTYNQFPGSSLLSAWPPDSLPSQTSHRAQVKRTLVEAATTLAAHGIDTARLDAETLLAHVLDIDRTRLLARFSSSISSSEQERFQQLIERRMRREPLAYIIGKREFWSRDFLVTPDVLIPRPETEFLVEATVKLVAQLDRDSRSPQRILDIGTGSGCIAITLAKELPTVELWAVDFSSAALIVADENARRHKVDTRVCFLRSDLFSSLDDDLKFDLIVSNPPYIAQDDLATLQSEVRDWEPKSALDGGKDGLTFYRCLVGESPKHLHPGGWLIMELGAEQYPAVTQLIHSDSNFQESFCVQDYAGFHRVIAAQLRIAPHFT